MKRSKIIYEETYPKGTETDSLVKLKEFIDRPGTKVFAKKHAELNDGTQELTVTIKFKSK